ncbi:MAG: T9SS type A sorting domain-containing protein [Ginsengibacter sp.]
MLHLIKALIIGLILIFSGVNSIAQNICAASNTISPASVQNICIGTSPSSSLTATITTSGSGNNGNITYTWYSNTTNSLSGGTMVQTSSTDAGTVTNTFTPPSSVVGSLWYYCTVSNDGGTCAGTSFSTSTVQVNVNVLPKIFNVTGGGTRCSNGAGLSVVLNGSENGVNYQLYKDGSTAGGPRSGTGNNLVSLVNNQGNYTIIATNVTTGCNSNMNGNTMVIVNATPNATYIQTAVSCQGNDGSITVTGIGGAPAYAYNIDGGIYSSNNIFTGLSVGNHAVSIKDANSCVLTKPAISIVNAAPLSVGINQVNPGGCAGNNGSITVSRVGGVDDGITPVQFELGGDVTRPYQTSNIFGGLSKGNYIVTVKDSKGCTGVSSTVTLAQNAGTAPIVYNVTGGGARCSNGSGLAIYLSGSQTGVDYQLQLGGTPVGTVLHGTGNPLSYFLNNAGSYTVVATNPTAGCTSDMNGVATITVNPAPTLYNVTGGGSRCSSGSGVSIYLSGSQVGVNYQLQKSGGLVGSVLAGTGSQLSFVVLNTGTYTIQASDATTGCINMMNGSASIVTNPAPNLFTVSGGGASCSSNSVTINLSGSETGVNYQLNNSGFPVGTALNGNGSPLSFLTSKAGTYQILATNITTGCLTYMTGSAVSTQYPPLTPSYSKYFASSCVGGDGTITITPGGGTPGYMYSVDGGTFGTNNYLTGLAAGDHEVVIKDANSCTFTYPAITVLTAPIMKVTANKIPASNCSGNDGSITGLYYGGDVDGITPLQYELTGDASKSFQTGNTFNGLAAGNYIVTIKDSKGCLAQSSTITLGTAAPLSFTSASYSTDVSSCGNGSDGNIAVGIAGGVPPYDFKLNGTDFGQSNVPFFGFPNLGIGTYTVSVSDLHNCSATQVFTIGQGTAPMAKVAYNGDETCIGKNNGYISLSPKGIGGIPPAYSYSKDGGATFQSSYSFTNLSPSTYSMVVRDSKGCVSAPVSITVKPGTVSCRIGNALDNGTENKVGNRNDNSNMSKSSFNSSLIVQAYPNPFGSEFTLNVQGNNQDKVFITVTDILGRRLYQAEGSANQQYKLGSNLSRGIFIVQVLQGQNIQTIKIVKE